MKVRRRLVVAWAASNVSVFSVLLLLLTVISSGAVHPALASCPVPSFSSPTSYKAQTATPQSVVVGDFNNDGKIDLVVAHSRGYDVFLGNGAGGFLDETFNYIANGPHVVAVADFNNDGNLDIAMTFTALLPSEQSYLYMSLGDGTGNFHGLIQDLVEIPGKAPSSIIAGDFDGDANIDVAVARFDEDDVLVFYGDGTGRFRPQAPFRILTGQGPISLQAADFNSDGGLDIATANLYDDTVTIWTTSLSRFSVPVGDAPNSVATGDFNHDGNLDLVTANVNSGNVSVLLGDGAGRFRSNTTYPVGTTPLSVAVGDFNRDGHLDLAVADLNGKNFSILLGDGAGRFGSPIIYPTTSEPYFIATGDFNGDGSPDIVLANAADLSITVRVNACSGPAIDLQAAAIEVTQAIQDLNNSVVLVAEKRTFARVHVASNVNIDNMTARLYGYDSSGMPLEPSVLRPSNAGALINITTSPSRGNLNDSFYFELPISWTHAGTIRVKAEVNPLRVVEETNYLNNTIESSVTFHTTKPLKVRLVDYQWRDAGDILHTNLNANADFDTIESELRRKLPFATVQTSRTTFVDESPPKTVLDSLSNPELVFDPKDYVVSYLLERLRYKRETQDASNPGVLYYMLMDRITGGRAEALFGWTAAGDAGSAAHEFGHLLGRRHVQCTPDPADEDDPDLNYPYPGGLIGGPQDDVTRFFGFDAGDASLRFPVFRRVIPNTAADEMSYCRDLQWFSDYNYTAVRDYVQGESLFKTARLRPATYSLLAPLPALSDAINGSSSAYISGDFLTIYGTIDLATDAASLTTLSRQPYVGEIPPLVPGPYHIRLLDGVGTILADYPFTPQVGTEGGTSAVIGQVVDFVAGTRRIEIYSEARGRTIASVAVSINRPTVSIISRSGGPNVPATGPVTITYSGSDPDGDALRYTLLYSFDNGATWRAIVTGVTDETITVDSSHLEGTACASTSWFRIVVNDGVLTGSADSGPFTVDGKAPVVRIVEPGNLSAYEYGQTVALEGVGQDLEDGTLDDGQLSWSSDIDGPLGTGHLVHPSSLSVGTHHITLTGSDSDGQIGSATVVVHIGYQNPMITCPPNQMVNTDSGQCSAVVNYPAPTVTDNLPGVTMNCYPASGTMFPIDTTTATCTATDVDRNTAGCHFSVRVVDATPPTITCPAPQVIECAGKRGAAASFSPTTADNCIGILTPQCAPSSGSLFPLGSTQISCSVTDTSGNSISCRTAVTVQDTTAPVVSSLSLNPSTLWPPDHRMVPVRVSAIASDTCDALPTCKVVSVSSNEPVNGLGDGDQTPDWQITGNLTLKLRAERSGKGNGRLYTITILCTDTSGNGFTAQALVTVPFSQGK